MITAFIIVLVFAVGTVGIVIAVALLGYADGRVAALETTASAWPIYSIFDAKCNARQLVPHTVPYIYNKKKEREREKGR